MRVYVASKFENAPEVQRVQKLLKAAGHVISHDWTNEDASKLVGEEREKYLQVCAQKDFDGVATCSVFFLINYEKCAGAYTEFGIALGRAKTIVVVDGHHPDKPRNIFFHLPMVHHFTSIEAAVEYVNKL